MLKDSHKQRDWLAKIDLKDAYFMIPVHHHDRKFPRFQIKGRHINSSAYHSAYTVHPGSLPRPYVR